MSEATKFNELVLAKLGKTVKRKDVKYKTSTLLSCSRCNKISKSISQLHEHMQFSHKETMNISIETTRRHSTKNNSL